MRDDGGEWDAPVLHALRKPVGDWDAILEIVSPLLWRHLLNMSRDEIHREDLTAKSEFASWISHFLF